MIDEKKLIEELNKQKHILTFEDSNPIDEGFNLGIDRSIQLISSQPKVGGWILCSERLPKPDECVLVSYRSLMVWNKDIYSDQIAIIREDGWHWWDELETKVENEIVAWMYLPKPYEEKEDDKQSEVKGMQS